MWTGNAHLQGGVGRFDITANHLFHVIRRIQVGAEHAVENMFVHMDGLQELTDEHGF
jgi:hypothetical protein